MTRTHRRLALAAGTALLLLTGCGDGEVRPGAAAIVGTERIEIDALQELVERGLADPQAAQQLGSDRAAFQRSALSRLINNEVLAEAAEDEGVEVREGEVDAQLARFAEQAGSPEALEMQAAQSGVSPQDLRPFVRSIVLDQALADELTADIDVAPADLRALYQENIAQYDRVRTRHILVADEKVAREILGNVQRDRSRFPALAAQFSTDTSNKDRGGDLGLAGRGQFVPEFEEAIFGADPGEIVLVKTQFGWHVVEVLERQTTSLEDATTDLRRSALQSVRQTRVGERIREKAAELGVKVNPRFGVWNAESGTVEAAPDPNGVLTPAPQGDQPLDADGEPILPEGGEEGEVPTGEAPAGEAPTGEAPTGEAPTGEAPTGEEPETAPSS